MFTNLHHNVYTLVTRLGSQDAIVSSLFDSGMNTFFILST